MQKEMKLHNLVKAFIPPIVVLIIHCVVFVRGFYTQYPWIDIPMHFAGGVAIGFTFSSLLKIATKKKLFENMHSGISLLFVIALVGLAAIFWEFSEFTLDYFTPIATQPSLPDTMADFFFGLIGAPLGHVLTQWTGR